MIPDVADTSRQGVVSHSATHRSTFTFFCCLPCRYRGGRVGMEVRSGGVCVVDVLSVVLGGVGQNGNPSGVFYVRVLICIRHVGLHFCLSDARERWRFVGFCRYPSLSPVCCPLRSPFFFRCTPFLLIFIKFTNNSC